MKPILGINILYEGEFGQLCDYLDEIQILYKKQNGQLCISQKIIL